jgi:multidrug efflux system membrane fusion protein
MVSRRIGRWLAGACLALVTGLLLSSCSGSEEKKAAAERPPAPVVLGQTRTASVPVSILAIGRVEALATVSVRSQVGGQLQKVHFAEGQLVKAGQLLANIDSRPYQAALDQALANLERDEATLKEYRREVERNQKMVERNFISRQDYDKSVAQAESQAATVKADQAAIEKARLDLAYCSITAPLTGQTGSLLINQGNLIQANSDTLVVIKQVQPTYVTFAVPERNLSQIRQRMAQATLKVTATLPPPSDLVEQGELTFVDNQVDAKTGTVTLKGTFANADLGLWPGQFVNVSLELYTMQDAVVAPVRAIQNGPQGQLVFVVKPDLTVEARPVQTGPLHDQDVVIVKGLAAGEKVVVDGQLALYPGAKVVESGGATPKPGAKAGAGRGGQQP